MLEIPKEGVGALIIQNDCFLTVEERHLSRKTRKVPGMRSMIFETIEVGENHNDALVRALEEEVRLIDLLRTTKLDITPLCKIQLNSGVWLHAYLIPIVVPINYPLEIGTSKDEVREPRWESLINVVRVPTGDLRYRPGNREVVRSYLNALPELIEQYVYLETKDSIPEEVYKEFESHSLISKNKS